MAIASVDEPIPLPHWPKKLRSKLLPRRRRVLSFPFHPPPISVKQLDLDSSSSSLFSSVISTDDSILSNPKKRVRDTNRDELRPITRLYAKRLENDGPRSESDCVSDIAVSELSHISGGVDLRDNAGSDGIGRDPREMNDACSPEVDQSLAIGNQDDLTCHERLSSGGERSEYSTCNEMTLSEFESELFGDCSEEYFSDMSQSYLTESSDNFSEKSRDDSTTSVAFTLFRELSNQLTLFAPTEAIGESDYSDDFVLLRFENEEDEESYRAFRAWERKVLIPDHSDEKILQERLLMVQWIVEHSSAMQLQNETLFLGVSLMDQFLSKGYFKSKKNIRLLGIACITLATRIEENQPYNNVRRRTFLVGECTFSRSEVVAMEWLVQKVLNFQCLLPTIYNFLWFYLKVARADATVESMAKYLAVKCLLDHNHLCFWPSSVAAGLVALASLAKDCERSCQWVMETHIRSRNDDLHECIKSLEWLVEQAARH